jgi:hypothetical protein
MPAGVCTSTGLDCGLLVFQDVFLKSLNAHLRNQSGMRALAVTGHSAIAEVIDRIDVYEDWLAVRLRSREIPGTTKLADDVEEPTDDRLLSIPLAEAVVQEIPANPVAPWLLAKGGPIGAAGTTAPSSQRHRARQALVGRDRLRFCH